MRSDSSPPVAEKAAASPVEAESDSLTLRDLLAQLVQILEAIQAAGSEKARPLGSSGEAEAGESGGSEGLLDPQAWAAQWLSELGISARSEGVVADLSLDRLRELLAQVLPGGSAAAESGLPFALDEILKDAAALPAATADEKLSFVIEKLKALQASEISSDAAAPAPGPSDARKLETALNRFRTSVMDTAEARPAPASASEPVVSKPVPATDSTLKPAVLSATDPAPAMAENPPAGQAAAVVNAPAIKRERAPNAVQAQPAGTIDPAPEARRGPPARPAEAPQEAPKMAPVKPVGFAPPAAEADSEETVRPAGSESSSASRVPVQPAAASLEAQDFSPGQRFEAFVRDQRPAAAADAAQPKSAETAASGGVKELPAAVRSGIFDQIVQRAAVHFKEQHNEMRIDLKPEYLGQVRLQIVTENQQVSVRIVTELAMVRDLLEGQLNQLKSDLQQQGLQVERLEVSVAADQRQVPDRQGRSGSAKFTAKAGRPGLEADLDIEPAMAASYGAPALGRGAIDMFV